MTNKMYEKLVEAQVSIASSLKGINDNLKILNDNNILHNTQTAEEHKDFKEWLKVMTEKYWWIIVVCIAGLFAIAGYKEVVKLFAP